MSETKETNSLCYVIIFKVPSKDSYLLLVDKTTCTYSWNALEEGIDAGLSSQNR